MSQINLHMTEITVRAVPRAGGVWGKINYKAPSWIKYKQRSRIKAKDFYQSGLPPSHGGKYLH